jgi:lipopolysaccharide export system protein LptA
MKYASREAEDRRKRADASDRRIGPTPHSGKPAKASRSRTSNFSYAIAFSTALLFAVAQSSYSWAQMISGSGPLNISGDHSELINNGKEWIVRGRVEATRGANRLRCDTLHVFFHTEKNKQGAKANTAKSDGLNGSNIERVVADGNVFIVTDDDVVRGDTAVYTADTNSIVVTGKQVILMRGENVAVGARLVVHRTQGDAILEGGPNGRPRAIIFPKTSSASPTAPSP